MPSTSKAQHNFMAAVANSPAFAKKAKIPQRVGADFMKADTGRKFAKGGDMKESKQMVQKEVSFMKKKGAPKSMVKHEMKETEGYAMGGFARKPNPTPGPSPRPPTTEYAKGGFVRCADGIAQRGKTKAKQIK